MSLRDASLEADRRRLSGSAPPLTVGLVNLMPDAAFADTETQFRHVLAAAADQHTVRIELYTLPEIRRAGRALTGARSRYHNLERLFEQPLDGLIVTGTEPQQADLRQEPYWHSLCRLIDWATDNTASTVFSCLAAHAAVLKLDGIERQRLPAKLTGLLACTRVERHWLTEKTPDLWHTPHSRWNGVSEADLTSKDYQILTRSPQAGADVFAKAFGSQFVFLQGHPEYQGDTLQREYRRDVRRFLTGETGFYPGLPANVFSTPIEAELNAVAKLAIDTHDSALLETVSQLARGSSKVAPWQEQAAQFYRNWLGFLAGTANARLALPL